MTSQQPTGTNDTTRSAADTALDSLAPKYEATQHHTYLARLNEAISEPKNLNIALTGRYGSGKSSVLDEFEKTHKSSTLRLAISTLGAGSQAVEDEDDEAGATTGSGGAKGSDLTNRIQKELVKQLVYSAKPSTLRHSRFRRSVPLTKARAVTEAVAAVTIFAAFAWYLGWRPPISGTTEEHRALAQVAAWAGFGALVVGVLTVMRLVTHDRWVVSDVSAAGATVTLSERTPTYFDEYLNDIAHYFDSEDINIVIFEDLDRFNDPHIFEALRELNTLLNNTNERIKSGKPLRFVYAVRDSLFELLGTDSAAAGDDAAVAETVRANRTKFFDIVIPVVPFISHRNASDLLQKLLTQAGITNIDRPLLNLVARHATDMRLLRNIRNEYLVFAERLLESSDVAPGLTESNLFALVAYKNFHLGDFEKTSRRSSDLDDLYDYRRDLVRGNIEQQELRKRELIAGRSRERARSDIASRLAQRLRLTAEMVKGQTGYSSFPYLFFQVGPKSFPMDELTNYPFWAALAAAGTVEISHGSSPTQPYSNFLTLNRDQLNQLVPEAFDAGRWTSIDAALITEELDEIDHNIAFLRRANFADLTEANYTVSVARPSSDGATTTRVRRTFVELVDETLKSDLAKDLVKRGYLDRNFALYAAQFYGTFTGVDVANFMVQNVQSNTMEVDYDLSRPGAVVNLLAETDDDFTRTVAAYNIDVVNYLLAANHPGAGHVIDRLRTVRDDDANTFLTAYLTSGAQRENLVARLAARQWRDVFNHVVTNPGVPDDQRASLLSAALIGADHTWVTNYEVATEVGQFITDHYAKMPAFTQPQTPVVTQTVGAMVARSNVLIPDLRPVDDELLNHLVDARQYLLTADNLRAALDITGEVTLDKLIHDEHVYDYCIAEPADYRNAVDNDPATTHIVTTELTLAQVLHDIAERWDDDQRTDRLGDLLELAPAQAQLTSLRAVPASVWEALAEAELFRASLSNVEAYRTHPDRANVIDDHLANLLEKAGVISSDGAGDTTDADGNELDRPTAALAILNADSIAVPATRVALVESLDLNNRLPVTKLNAESTNLFALLLDHDLVNDDAASFTHFHAGGWAAIGPAIAASRDIATFLEPGHIHGMVTNVFDDHASREKLGDTVAGNLDAYVPDAGDDATGSALLAGADYANTHNIPLPADTVVRIATAAASSQGHIVCRLLLRASPAATGQHVIDAFFALGHPYSQIVEKDRFDIPKDAAGVNKGLLDKLDPNKFKFRQRPLKDAWIVTVT